ncbi:hypothetical protein ACFL3C_04340 [Patescibacteria group bacterium]
MSDHLKTQPGLGTPLEGVIRIDEDFIGSQPWRNAIGEAQAKFDMSNFEADFLELLKCVESGYKMYYGSRPCCITKEEFKKIARFVVEEALTLGRRSGKLMERRGSAIYSVSDEVKVACRNCLNASCPHRDTSDPQADIAKVQARQESLPQEGSPDEEKMSPEEVLDMVLTMAKSLVRETAIAQEMLREAGEQELPVDVADVVNPFQPLNELELAFLKVADQVDRVKAALRGQGVKITPKDMKERLKALGL